MMVSTSPAPLRRNAAASSHSGDVKQATPCSKAGNSITMKRRNLTGPSQAGRDQGRVKRMPRQIIDISVPLENDVAADPPGYGPKIEYRDHKSTAAEIVRFFPGLTADDLPDREGWAMEWIRLSTHCTTHLDAP